MAFLPLILGHLKIAGYVLAALAVAIFIGWIGHLLEAHKRDQAALILASQQLHTAEQTNAGNISELGRIKAENAKALAAVAEANTLSQKRAADVAKIRNEVSHAAKNDSAIPPGIAAAVLGVRERRAARLVHQDPGRENHAP